jgi:integrase
LHKLLPELGMATHDCDAALVRNIVREWRERTGPADLRTITSALRSYLRFLASAGLCRPNLDHAIPPVVQWRLASLPPPRLIASLHLAIDSPRNADATGRSCSCWRVWDFGPGMSPGSDSAILTGRTVRLRLSGKARREVRLPLPQEVGDALLAYIEQERPRVDQEPVFLTMVAPYQPFTHSSHVSAIGRWH